MLNRVSTEIALAPARPVYSCSFEIFLTVCLEKASCFNANTIDGMGLCYWFDLTDQGL